MAGNLKLIGGVDIDGRYGDQKQAKGIANTFIRYRAAHDTWAKEAASDEDFFYGRQWTQDQIAKLEQQRDEAVQGVLTPEQAEKVKKLVDEGKAKRGATAKRKKGEAAPNAADSASN